MNYFKFLYFIFAFSVLAGSIRADEQPKEEVGIIEKLGESVPLDISVLDEYGKPVTLRELMNDKPAVLSLVYYRCPGICSPLLTGVSESVNLVDLEPGKDFNVITVSFDPSEGHIIGSEKKKSYLEELEREIPESSWRFVTSDSVNIKRLTEAVGWGYKKQGVDYIHGAGIMVLSPEGKISRYLYGTTYLPTDLKMAIIEASEGRVGTTISKLMQMCFSYDPDGRKYVLNVTRISGAAIILILAVFFTAVVFKKRKSITNNI
jgi:protein SCO1/2